MSTSSRIGGFAAKVVGRSAGIAWQVTCVTASGLGEAGAAFIEQTPVEFDKGVSSVDNAIARRAAKRLAREQATITTPTTVVTTPLPAMAVAS